MRGTEPKKIVSFNFDIDYWKQHRKVLKTLCDILLSNLNICSWSFKKTHEYAIYKFDSMGEHSISDFEDSVFYSFEPEVLEYFHMVIKFEKEEKEEEENEDTEEDTETL